MEVKQILVDAVKKGASDIFIITGARLAYKIDNKVTPQEGQPLMPSDTKAAVYDIFSLAGIDIGSPDDLKSEMDFSFSIAGTGRFRANIYRQRGSFRRCLGACPLNFPTAKSWEFPKAL